MIGILYSNVHLAWRVLQCLALDQRTAFLLGNRERGLAYYQRSRSCRGWIELDAGRLCAAPEEAAETLRAVCREAKIERLIAADMPTTALLAKAQTRLAPIEVFPCVSARQIQRLNNKIEFARMLQQAGISQPRFQEIRTVEDLRGLGLGYPVVIKPASLEFGLGVRTCMDPPAAAEHVRNLARLAPPPYLAQEFIPGDDLDFSLLANHGEMVAWTIFHCSSRLRGERLASYRFQEHEPLLEVGRRLVRALGFHGLAHLDMRIDARDGSVKPLDLNPHVYGSIHCAAYAGVNFIQAGLALQQGAVLRMRQENGVVNGFSGCVRLLFDRRERIPIYSKATQRGLLQLLRDPVPFLLSKWARLQSGRAPLALRPEVRLERPYLPTVR